MTIIQGPYRADPDFPGDIQTADGSREIASITPYFFASTGATDDEVDDTAKLLAASWELRRLLTEVMSTPAQTVSGPLQAEITALLERIPCTPSA